MRRQYLLFEAADRHHPALQRDLAGHADSALDRPAGEQRRERGDERDTGAWTILRHGARRHVEMEFLAGESVIRDAQRRA